MIELNEKELAIVYGGSGRGCDHEYRPKRHHDTDCGYSRRQEHDCDYDLDRHGDDDCGDRDFIRFSFCG